MGHSLDGSTFPEDLPVLPDGWRYELLEELVEDRGVSYGIVQPGNAAADGVPIVRVNNIRDGRIDTNDVLRVESEIESKFQRSRLHGGEVLLTLVGTLGEVAIVPDSLCGWNVARAVGVIPVRRDPGNRWVAMCLRSAFVQHCIRTWATTTVQATFNLRDLKKLPIPVAPQDARTSIGEILGALDDKIELNRRMNATLEAMARALFQSWFVDFDPVRAKLDGRAPANLDPATAASFPASFQDSPLGPIPQGWTPRRLAELVDVVKGRSYRSAELAESKTALVTLKSFLRGGGYRHDGLKPFTGGYKPQQQIFAGDLVIAFTDVTQDADVIGKPALIRSDERFDTLVASLDVGIVKPKGKQVSKEFLYCLFLSTAFQAHAYSHATGTTVLHLSGNAVPSFTCIEPPQDLMRRFSEAVAPAFKLIDENAKQARTLTTLRDTLLPKLLSGEISVSAAERAVP